MDRPIRGWLLLLLLALGACVGTGVDVPYADPDSAGLAPTTFDQLQLQIFDERCARQCHSGGSASRGLRLEAGVSIANLVGVASNEVPEMMRVAPGRPDDSYLVIKLRPSDPRRVGARMPRIGAYLTQMEIRAVERWIAAGAKADWEDDDPVDPVVVDDDDSAWDDDDSAWDDDDSAWDDDDSAWDDDDSAWDDDDSGDSQ